MKSHGEATRPAAEQEAPENRPFPNMPPTLPRFAHDLLSQAPHAGQGVHLWLFRCARQLHAHLPACEIVALLEGRIAGCGRNVPRSEIVSAVQNSIGCAWHPRTHPTAQHAAKWPAVNREQREAITHEGYGLADLWELSPLRLVDNAAHTEQVIDRLFPSNQLLCCGQSKWAFDTKPREEWRGELSDLQLIVPSPMTAVTGHTKDGKESKHTLSNTGSRRFLVCEFDKGECDEQAALLLHLAGYAPMVCAVHSGGKSLHGWFFVQDQPEEKVSKFFRYAVSLGADPATWTRSQFVRLPDGRRDNGNRQRIYFLNFKPMETTL